LTRANNQLHTLPAGASGAAPLVNRKKEKRRQKQAAKLAAEQPGNIQANGAQSSADIKRDMQELEARFREQVLEEEYGENGQFDPAEGDPYYSDEEVEGYSGSYGQNHNRPSTLLSNSTVPEETDDSFSEQLETSNPFDDRDGVPSGRNLLVLVDPNRTARNFGPVSRKLFKSSELFSSINSTISKDNTAGEWARQAKMFADFGQKMKMKPCGFGTARREEDRQFETVDPDLEETYSRADFTPLRIPMEPTLSAEDEVSSGYLYIPGTGKIEVENDSQSRRRQFATPLNRQMSQTPRMSQASPLQGPIAQTPQMPMMGNQPIKMTPQTAHMLQQQRMQAAIRQREQAMSGIVNGQQMNQQQFMQVQQMMRAQAQQNHPNQAQLVQNYNAQLAVMAQAQRGNIPQNMHPAPSLKGAVTGLEPRNMRDIFPGQSTTTFPPSPPLDPLDYQQAKAVHLGRRNTLRAEGIAAYRKRKERDKVAQRQREQSNGDKRFPRS
jgi:hypothetical protein